MSSTAAKGISDSHYARRTRELNKLITELRALGVLFLFRSMLFQPSSTSFNSTSAHDQLGDDPRAATVLDACGTVVLARHTHVDQNWSGVSHSLVPYRTVLIPSMKVRHGGECESL
ncbi:hypothetical protein FRC03_007301 [Tulasnella sp. 419]|nr:hypothetical protein FRC03_007301 [Tulasnella sp. 419]